MSQSILPHEADILERALFFAIKAHARQVDRCGLPFVLHPIRVSEKQTTIIRKCIALLHDTIEDTPTTYEDIEEEFGTAIARSVRLLSRGKDQPYNSYVRVLLYEGDKDAWYVKKADIEDNTDIRRMDEKAAKRFPMYQETHRMLCKVIGVDSHLSAIL